MIMPINLPDIDDKVYKNICIKHINAGLLKGGRPCFRRV